jgi:hypothetical protein
MSILPNEANSFECWTLWNILMSNALEVLVRQFVTWLRLSKIGFVRTILGFIWAIGGPAGLDLWGNEANAQVGASMIC